MTVTGTAPGLLPVQLGYDLWAQHYDVDGNPLCAAEQAVFWRHAAPAFDEAFARAHSEGRQVRVLELGCGTGRHALAVGQLLLARGGHLLGLDFSEGMLQVAREKTAQAGLQATVSFVRHDLTACPFPTATLQQLAPGYDVIYCALVVEHLPDLRPLFSQARGLLVPGGRFIVTTVHPDMYIRKGMRARFIDPETGLRRELEGYAYEIEDVARALEQAGFGRVPHDEGVLTAELNAQTNGRGDKYLGHSMALVFACVA